MKIIISAVAVLVLLAVVPSVMAMPMPETFADGWYDAYNNWVRSGAKPDDDSSHSELYYNGFNTGWKYAREHVKVIVEQGHVLTDMKACGIYHCMESRPIYP